MAKPWFGLTNLFTDGAYAITALGESSVYPAANLGLEGLKPYRSAAVAAAQWVRLVGASASPDTLFGHAGHNLQTGATVGIWRGDPTGSPTEIETIEVTAGEPFLITWTAAADTSFFAKFTDTTNPDGYIEIPYLFLGTRLTMPRSFNPGSVEEQFAVGTVTEDGAGGVVAYPHTGELWSRQLEWLAEPADMVILRQVNSRALAGKPFVFCENGDDSLTARYVRRAETFRQQFKHLAGRANLWTNPLHSVAMNLVELGA